MVTGADLKTMRLQAGKSKEEMANFIGIESIETYNNWEQGNDLPGVNQYLGLVDCCGFDVAKLINMYITRGNLAEAVDLKSAKLDSL